MPTWGELQRWNPEPLHTAVDDLNAAYNSLIDFEASVAKLAKPEGWTGPSAELAEAQAKEIGRVLEEYAADLSGLRRVTGETADSIEGIRNGVAEADELARRHAFRIADDGNVIDNAALAGSIPADPDERRTRAAEIAERVGATMAAAGDLSDDYVAVLNRLIANNTYTSSAGGGATNLAAAGLAGDALGTLTPLMPPPDTSASRNAAWWSALSTSAQWAFALNRPELIGSRSGVPTRFRDAANCVLLEGYIDRLKAKVETLKQKVRDNTHSDYLVVVSDELGEAEERLAALEVLRSQINSSAANAGASPDNRIFLLDIDSDAKNGRVIVSVGNPDTASNVATFVPGTTSGVNDGLIGNIDRAENMANAAKAAAPEKSTAVIMWLDYDAPEFAKINPRDTPMLEVNADRAKDALHQFQEDLRVTHEGEPSRNTVIGHSYGSTVVGVTSRDLGIDADQLVFVGSPGVGVEHVHDLNITGVGHGSEGGHVHVGLAPDDPIGQWAGTGWGNEIGQVIQSMESLNPAPDIILGKNPDQPSFGATVFQPGTSGHSAYMEANTPSVQRIGEVISGTHAK
ncbi:alpha/beta hydrolase [Amycolatopsis sp. 195334CR]|uniref:alpha/beta hydrolase n=1 Tax=Amycolatopsis sp. 195334CR TaxID=2814588 RepID=UPI001A8C311D|nr:alpha/beta hydrolase [Amycolatopsis sp. 195334CR]MBN6039990.1 hypothetical protein [Amycolatopsis sp. 195334CR]